MIADSRPRHRYRLPDGREVAIVFDHGEVPTVTSTFTLESGEVVPMTLIATADNLTDAQIRAYRDEHRWAGDADVVRCCNAALGLPTGDGALGLLDPATCRARLVPRIFGNAYYATDAINARAKAVR